MLAYSFSTRTFADLTSSPFELTQSAPVLYLYIVKTITILFGNTEITLRLFSFISYMLTLGAVFLLSKNTLKLKYPLFPTAFIAILSFFILYSNEFKPYMSDALSVLFVILIYYLYDEKRLTVTPVLIIFVILIWFSNPVCFFIGSILLIELIDSFRKKQFGRTKLCIICSTCVLFSFLIYYIYWLKPVIDAGGMTNFWENHKFPLIPSSKDDIIHGIQLIKAVISHLGLYRNLIFFICVIGFFINLILIQNKFINIIYTGIFICLFASMLGLYPVKDRLFLFIYPLLVILFFFFINELYSSKTSNNIIISAVSLLLLFTSNISSEYLNAENVYKKAQETNFAIEYIIDNINEDESLYVYHSSVPGFAYKNNYNLKELEGKGNEVIIGKFLFDNNQNIEDIQLILNKTNNIYILTSHLFESDYYQARITPFLDSLQEHGTLKIVYDKYDTNIYYYIPDYISSVSEGHIK